MYIINNRFIYNTYYIKQRYMGNIPQDALDVIAKENKMRITDELRRQSRSHEIDSLREYAVEQGYTVPEFTKTKETLEAEMLEAGKLVVLE